LLLNERRSHEIRIKRRRCNAATGVALLHHCADPPVTRAPRSAAPRGQRAGEYGSVIVGKLLKKDQYNYGFDSQTCGYGNLVTKGIVDPTEVVRSAAARCLKK